jgi:PncC family amidohydrolase
VAPTAEGVVRRLVETGLTVATAESLTGGLVGAAITGVSGSSAVYVGGVVSYATRVKVEVLGVSPEVVEAEGVVSAACAAQMAEGVRRVLGADLGVSTTGVAGPDLQEGKPAGTVHVGLAGPAGTVVLSPRLDGDRAAIRAATVDAALGLVVETLRDRPREVVGLE